MEYVPSSLFSSSRSFRGRSGVVTLSPLLSLFGRSGLGSLLAPEGETWPLGVCIGVDLGRGTQSSMKLLARGLADLRRFAERVFCCSGSNLRSGTSTRETVVSVDEGRDRWRIIDGLLRPCRRRMVCPPLTVSL